MARLETRAHPFINGAVALEMGQPHPNYVDGE